jgi:hypothetical protein
LRSAPIFDDYDGNTTEKYLFDISYQIFIIVIMVAIITGIIIDTFSDLRANRAAVQENQMNICFICGYGREIFERHRYVVLPAIAMYIIISINCYYGIMSLIV